MALAVLTAIDGTWLGVALYVCPPPCRSLALPKKKTRLVWLRGLGVSSGVQGLRGLGVRAFTASGLPGSEGSRISSLVGPQPLHP